MPGRPTIWMTVGQCPIVLAVGAGGGCLDIFTLVYSFVLLFLCSFSLNGHGGHVGHVTQLICINFHFHSPSSFHMNFGSKLYSCFSEKQVLTLKSE